jgi:hypothetical protein
MSVRPYVLTLLAVAALGLSACGGSEEETEAASGEPTAAEDEQLREAQVKFAECMREQGIDMPDPKPGGQQVFKVGGDSGIDPQEFEEASEECEKYRSEIRPNLSDEEREEFKERALEFARCMREQGIDMPDPQIAEDGGVRIGGGGEGRGRSFDPEDPDFQAAQEECGGDIGMRREQP